jgi:hypothetical protein
LKAGSGHLAHAGHGGHFVLFFGQTLISGHFGQTGGTIADFNMYKSSLPFGTSSFLTVLSVINSLKEKQLEINNKANNK